MESKVDLLIKNGTCLIWNPTKGLTQEKVDIAVVDKKISHIQSGLNLQATQIIDASGLHVLPGVIDSQVHFREPGFTHKEDIHTGSKAAALGGVTSFFEMPNTNPATTTLDLFKEKIASAHKTSYVNFAFFVGASAENTLELQKLEKLPGCPGVKVFMGSSTGSLLIDSDELLEEVIRNCQRRIIVHSEDEARLKARKPIAIDSKDPHSHPIWRDEQTALLATQRLLSLAEKYNKKVHVLHISTSEEMEFLKNKKHLATVEILPQYLTLFAPDCYDKLGNFAQQNPPIRDKKHFEPLWQAVRTGIVDVIGSDHAPHTKEEKNKPYPQSPSGMPGVQTLVPIMLNHVHEQRLSLERFVELVTEGPRKVFGVVNKGRIQKDFDADFTLVDLKKTRTIENKWIASKCGWTPYHGMKVTGWPTHTIVGGTIIMQEDHVLEFGKGNLVEFE